MNPLSVRRIGPVPRRIAAVILSGTNTLRDGERNMTTTFIKQVLSIGLSFLLAITAVPFEARAQQPPQPGPAGAQGQPAPLSPADLQQLLAPIALYPDALVAQILGAATFPDQIAEADGWLQQYKNLGAALPNAVDAQPWDPSVKALTQFPSVLDNLAKNLAWTSALGEAYHLQATDVMAAVQVLRAKAQAAGNLKSGSQITVVQQAPQVIVIQPTNPQVVYVPTYNYAVVYGTPYVVPYYPPPPPTAAVVAFGVGIAVGVAMSNSWGYSYWNCNWHGGTVVYRSGVYHGNPAWHGGYYGGARPVPYGTTARVGTAYNPNTGTVARGAAVSTPYGTAAAGRAYNPSTGTVARGASASNAYGSAAAAQAYNPNTGAYAATHQTSNAYGSSGSSVYSKNGNTAVTQHQTTAQGSVGSVQTSAGGSAVAASGKYGNSGAAGQTANGNKYAAANGNVYKNTGSGWSQSQGGSSSPASRGYGTAQTSSGASAYSGGGWESKAESARGSASRSSGGGSRRR